MLTPITTNTTFFANAPEEATHICGSLFWKLEDGVLIPYIGKRWCYDKPLPTTALFCDVTFINRYEEHEKYFHEYL